jgi:hypothetical protein
MEKAVGIDTWFLGRRARDRWKLLRDRWYYLRPLGSMGVAGLRRRLPKAG